MNGAKTLRRLKDRLEKRSFVEDKYSCETRLVDHRFGRITIWSRRGGDDLLIMKKRVSSSAEDCLRDLQHARERLKINQCYLMKMVDFSVRVQALGHFEVWGFYQAPLLDLKKELASRRSRQRWAL